MSYALKYTVTYCDEFERECVVRILENNYVGAVTELESTPRPFEKTYDSKSDFKAEPIRSSSAKATFLLGNGFDLEELWTADERQYKLEHTIDGLLDWVGFIIPNGFSYNFTGGLYEAEVEASDGLKNIKALPFLDDNTGEVYGLTDLTYNDGFNFPFILIATEILRKLDLDLDLWTCVDIYEKTMATTGDREADPLANSFVNVRTYIEDGTNKEIPYWYEVGNVWNCEEVLTNLLQIFNAKIYQSQGVWRIKRINADIDYGTGATQRYWRKYNTLAVYLGKETINDEITIPCDSKNFRLIENDHTLSMDDVYKKFRVNYEFQLLREGDTPINLLPDNLGNNNWENDSVTSSPPGWFRRRDRRLVFGGNLEGLFRYYPALRRASILDASVANLLDSSVLFGEQAPGLESSDITRRVQNGASLAVQNLIRVNQGDKFYFNFFAKTYLQDPKNNNFLFITFRIYIEDPSEDQVYYLTNEGNTQQRVDYTWRRAESKDFSDSFFLLVSPLFSKKYGTGDYAWREINKVCQQSPIDGILKFEIYGLTRKQNIGYADYNGLETRKFKYLGFKTDRYQVFEGLGLFEYEPDDGELRDKLRLSNVFFGVIRDPNDQAEAQDYIFDNPNQNYTLQVEPITVYNGDTLDEDHLSKITVPTNVSGLKNFWDTIDNKFGYSSIGLIQCKSIMELYVKPYRRLEGTVKALDAQFDSRYVFEAIPGKKFILNRGTFNAKLGYIEDATFVEIESNDLTGGTEGEDTLNPDWQPTGLTRCVKDVNDLNTGDLEQQEQDQNQNSETFGDIRWTNIGQNLTECPLGAVTRYYYGTDDVSLDINNLNRAGVLQAVVDGVEECVVTYDNPGGEYIYFVHLASIGNVFEVTTDTQDNIVSDFQYLSDITLDGSLYRVLRQDYITTEFSNFTIRFKLE